jgi:hypothetical protein
VLFSGRYVWRSGGVLEAGRWRDGDEVAVIGAGDLPVAIVHIPVVPVTEKGKVGKFV